MSNHILDYEIQRICDEVGIKNNKILSFRPEGKKIKGNLIDKISNNNASFVNLNFDKIEICDVSVVDEVVLETMLYVRESKLNMVVFLTNLDEYVYDSVNAAQLLKEQKLSKEQDKKIKIPLLYYSNSHGLKILGELEAVLIDTFQIVKDKGKVTAREIALSKNIAINSASNRLKKLYDYGLILRKTVTDDSGMYYEYLVTRFI